MVEEAGPAEVDQRLGSIRRNLFGDRKIIWAERTVETLEVCLGRASSQSRPEMAANVHYVHDRHSNLAFPLWRGHFSTSLTI